MRAAERRKICSPRRKPWETKGNMRPSRGAAKPHPKNIFRIVRDTVLHQEIDELFVERTFSMMAFLRFHISRNC